MSSTYHIPFPSNYLSLNTPVKKSNMTANTTPLTPPAEATSHSFLTNVHIPSDRKSSMSSVSSSEPASSPTKESAPAGAFLPLNSKYKAPGGAFGQLPASPFLSNRADELRRGSC